LPGRLHPDFRHTSVQKPGAQSLQVSCERAELLFLDRNRVAAYGRQHANADTLLVNVNAAAAAVCWFHVVLLPPREGTLGKKSTILHVFTAGGGTTIATSEENVPGHIHGRAQKRQRSTGLRFAGRHSYSLPGVLFSSTPLRDLKDPGTLFTIRQKIFSSIL
jgi:hypothetical protein